MRTESRIPAGSGTRRPTGEREAIADRRIPDEIRERLVRLALDETDLSPREFAVRFTVNAGIKSCHVAAQNQASGGARDIRRP